MTQIWFITGTDTGVGKTYFIAWLIRHWIQRGRAGAGLKPIACGDPEDARVLQAAAGNCLSLSEITACHFSTPVTPWLAAQRENRSVDFSAARQCIQQQQTRFTHLAIEGVGGWLVPLAPKVTVREWAQQLHYPVVVVARAGLGTLNHTLLTVESIQAAGLTCAGLVLNDYQTPPGLARDTNPGLLAEWTSRPVFVFDQAAEKAGSPPAWLL